MKIFISASACFLVIVVSLSFFLYYLDRDVNILCKELEQVTNKIDEKNWKRASELAEDFEKKWDKKKKYMSLFFDHSELAEISVNVYLLKYCCVEEKNEAKQRIITIVTRLQQIKNNEKPTLENII